MFNYFSRFRAAVKGNSTARQFKEETDIATAALLGTYRNLLRQEGSKLNPRSAGAVFQQAVEQNTALSFDEHQKSVQNALLLQMNEMFRAVIDASKEPSSDAASPLNPDSFPILSMSKDAAAANNQKMFEDSLIDKYGYCVIAEKSGIENAGKGLFVKGKAPAGSIIAIYPGTVYLPDHFRNKQFLEEVSNNPYARARFDKTIIDAKNENRVSPKNPFALGQMINHPPAGSSANVMPVAFDFPNSDQFLDGEFKELVPNSFVTQPSIIIMYGKNILVKSIILMATSEIEDEEVFLNYRYNPNFPLPDWYTPVDIEDDKKLWA